MKLIIDIDKDYYKIIQKNGGSNYVEDAVLNGTPLEDIKAEINKIRDSWEQDNYHDEADALLVALKIIDKHIGERSEE